MTMGPVGLFLIVLASASVGCCFGMGVMAMCRVSALNRKDDDQ